MPLQYLLLFPYGTDGWRRSIEFTQATNVNRKAVSMREFYAFRLQFQDIEGKTLLQGGRLFQQFVVDCYAAIEQDRLNFVRCNQNILHSDLYSGLRDAVTAGDADAAEVDIYIIEYQKRGLLHSHIILTLAAEDKLNSPEEIDEVICAEIPNEVNDPLAFETTMRYMIHGPCGDGNLFAPRMVNGKCSKHYPKKFSEQTTVDENGFVIYRQRNFGKKYIVNGVEIDNRWVIPYNRDLIVKYNAHINLERCVHTKLIKYLYKYVHKGPDRATVVLENNVARTTGGGQYSYSMTDEYPSVERLQYHLPGEQSVLFKDSENIPEIINQPGIHDTMFTKWFQANIDHPLANHLTYEEFPRFWVWNKKEKEWKPQQQRMCIGKLNFAHPNSGERYYLRMMLTKVRGEKCYEDVRTINGVVYPTYKAACIALGLLDDDNEWGAALIEASTWASGSQLRNIFCSMLMFSEVTNPLELWENHWVDLTDDLQNKVRRLTGDVNLSL
ncbi:hypothetical protein RHGRI_011678 [Rhododendron griersonianum]|uniref:Helitron helicase-like domain-containing protein n=1 Tax=Rhododendron griersonianum TaxID=479676 RepID=A0AAV6KNV8_9ERIC|nr:hypothetical protein RHGRI_011678 [Rhododendron griersonianum]